ncbi:hypothetical protein [Lyngbya sp. PCC 8106]|uniref:hypothetical protein n=1 Tax=Lyngbya sp. (strain PCC 8106) TaxID=313612 RepID=UPI0000EADA07|nr:hypothetical protein [Lyngbya sp. PCC 8106]EAW33545.1 hypothetical protein L8106_30705 [Lyngbya sp. PCC 8106]
MNTNKSGLIGLTTILTSAILIIEKETQTVSGSSVASKLNTKSQDKSFPVLFSGKFKSETLNYFKKAEISKENGQFYLKLSLKVEMINADSDFYLLLNPKKQPSRKHHPQEFDQTINLGILQKSPGVQYYSLSKIQNPAQYKSVIICSERNPEIIACADLEAASRMGSIMKAISEIGDIIENQ